MLSNTRVMLREIESAVDALRDRAWRPSDAVLADTLYTLGDAIAELDRLMLQLHRELVQRHPADTPESGSPLPLPNGEDLARSDSVHRPSRQASGALPARRPDFAPCCIISGRNVRLPDVVMAR